jgi:hypothetical protein
MANWANPTLTSAYTNFVTEVKDRDVETAVWFEGMSPTNLPTNAKRLNVSTGRFEKWNGSAWVDAVATFTFPALSVAGTLAVTGAATFSGTVTLAANPATNLQAATKQYVDSADTLKANLAGPTFTGVPTAPTAAVDTNTTQLATTAFVIGQAYAKLASPTFTGTVTAPTLTATGQVTFSSTGAAVMNTGTTAQRPASPNTGMFRYNSTLGKFEGFTAAGWGSVGGGATGGSTDDIFYENGQTVTANYTITSGKNAMSSGPVTISSGITVTVPSGSNWVVV